MRAGSLSDLIVIQKRVLTVNANGGTDTSWIPDTHYGVTGSAWCEADRRSETNARFTTWYNAEITVATRRILWDSAIWNIVSATHDRHRSITVIDSDFSEMIEVTHLKSTEREFIDGLPLVNE